MLCKKQTVPNSQPNSVLSQNLNQITFYSDFVWFIGNSVTHFQIFSDSKMQYTSLNFSRIQKTSEITLQIVLKDFWISTISWNFSEIFVNQYWLWLTFRNGKEYRHFVFCLDTSQATEALMRVCVYVYAVSFVCVFVWLWGYESVCSCNTRKIKSIYENTHIHVGAHRHRKLHKYIQYTKMQARSSLLCVQCMCIYVCVCV